MNLQESLAISNLCRNLTGKTFNKKYVLSVFRAPLIRTRTKELMKNIIDDNFHLNEPILNQYNDFEVLVLFFDHYTDNINLQYTVTPIQEVINKIFEKAKD